MRLVAERIGCMPAPARIIEKGPRQRDHVSAAVRQNLFSLMRLRDQANRAGRNARRLSDLAREIDLISGLERHVHPARMPPLDAQT